MATIRQIMNERAVAVHVDDTVLKAIEALTREHTSSLPVVDDDGAVLGMISELAMIDVVFEQGVRDAVVANYMTSNVPCVEPDDSLARVAQLFALYSFRRLPVVENGKLVGMATCRDLLNYALRTREVLAEPLMELIPSLAPLS